MPNDPEIDEILTKQRRERHRQRLRWFGVVAALIVSVIVLAFVSQPYLRSERDRGREASAIGSLRSIVSAQIVFSLTCGGNYATKLTQLGRAGDDGRAPLGPDLTFADRVEKMGYQIWIDAEPTADAPGCSSLPAGQVARSYVARAEPLPDQGTRFFAMSSESGDVYHGTAPVRFVNGVATGDAAAVR